MICGKLYIVDRGRPRPSLVQVESRTKRDRKRCAPAPRDPLDGSECRTRARFHSGLRKRARFASGVTFALHPAMIPSARISAAIEILADIQTRRRPAADAMKDWGLAHRFAGSGDRAAISGLLYDALR